MMAASAPPGPTPPLPVVVDASVWVARYVPTDAFHAASTSWLTAQVRARRTLISPALLLPELAGSVARVLNDTALGLRVARSTARLSRVRLVPVDAALAGSAYRLAATRRLRGADAVYAALAQRLGLRLVSWDGEQIALASAVTP
jgi:predicted nucleic acid-binding protein